MKRWIGLAVLCMGLIFGSYVDSDGAYRVKNNGQIIATTYASINAVVAAAGSNKETLVVDSSDTLAANLTIPSTLTLKIPQGGMIVKANTYTLAINGPFEAGLYQVFSGFASGDVTGIDNPNPLWWGADRTGTTDSTLAFNCAAKNLRPESVTGDFAGGKVKVSRGKYKITGTITAAPGIVFEGEGGSQYNYQAANLAAKVTWISHEPTVADTDCFVFDLNTWDTYGRSSGAGITDMYISGNATSRRLISYPNGFIKPILEGVRTNGGSVGLYGRYGIESNIWNSTFGQARDIGVHIDYVTTVSTSVYFWGCRIDGNGITKTGLRVDGATTVYYFGGLIDECTEYHARIGVTLNAEVYFHGTHMERGPSGTGLSNYMIRVGEYSGGTKSVVHLTNVMIFYVYADLTNKVGVAAEYANVVLNNSKLGPGYAFSATANTGQVHIDSGCIWGNNWNTLGVPAAATSAEMVKIVGNSISGLVGGYAGAGHRSGHHADLKQAITYGANITPDLSLGGMMYIALTGDMTIAIPSVSASAYTIGSIISFDFQADASSRLVKWNTTASPTWKTQYAVGGTGAQEETVSANTRHTIRFYWDGTNWVQLGATAVIVN